MMCGLVWIVFSGATRLLRAQADAGSQASSQGTVTGRVINAASGAPIPRVLVQMGSVASFTDHDGRFLLPDVAGGSNLVELMKPGYFTSPEQTDPAGIQISSADLTKPLELRLYPEGLLTGTVVAQDGGPLALITVTARKLTASGAAHRMQTVGSTQTDSHGDFRLSVPAGDYQLTTQYVAVAAETGLSVLPAIAPVGGNGSTLHVSGGEQQQVELRPHTGVPHTVSLAVKGMSDDRSTTFVVTGANGATWQMSGEPDSDMGEVALRLPAGSYMLEVNSGASEGITSGQMRLNVPDRDVSGVALQLSPVPAIPVEVGLDLRTVGAGGAPTAQQLGLELVPEQQSGKGSREDSIRLQSHAGRQPFFAPLPGQYRLTSSTRGGWYIVSASFGGTEVLGGVVTVAAGAGASPLQLTVSNVTGSVQGQVAAAGTPVSGLVELIASFPTANPIFSVRSGADGTFSAQNLQPGSYFAVVLEHRTSADLLDPAVRNGLGSRVQSFAIQAGVQTTVVLDGRPTP